MKQKITSLLLPLFIALTIIVGNYSYSQSIRSNKLSADEYTFQVNNLSSTATNPVYFYLWWYGDNQFSFTDTPTHKFAISGNHLSNRHALAVVTDGYGSNGPPPLRDGSPIYSALNTSPLQPVITSNDNIQIQHYRNALKGDTMYLIVSYRRPTEIANTVSGKIELSIDSDAHILSNMIAPNYLPNGEIIAGNDVYFHHLNDEERNILIPVKISSTSMKRNLSFSAEMSGMDGNDANGVPVPLNTINGSLISEIRSPMVKSHDPNFMTEESEAQNKCNFGGEKIEYTVHFQNIGEGATENVRVVCHFDDKVDVSSISNILVPDAYASQAILRKNQLVPLGSEGVANYFIDEVNRTITFNFDDLELWSPKVDACKNLDRTRSSVTFSILAKPNYVFGPAIVAHSVITFDENQPISTDPISIRCDDPVSPGSFSENTDASMDSCAVYLFWTRITISILVILLITLFIFYRKQKRSNSKK